MFRTALSKHVFKQRAATDSIHQSSPPTRVSPASLLTDMRVSPPDTSSHFLARPARPLDQLRMLQQRQQMTTEVTVDEINIFSFL